MAEIVKSLVIDAPPPAVWDAIVDFGIQSQWMLGTTVRATYREGQGVGGRFEAFTGLGRLGFLDTIEITAWDPPYRIRVRHTGRLIRGAGAFEIEPLPDGRSRLEMSEWLELPLGLLGQVGFLAVRPAFEAGIVRSQQRLARLLERAAPTSRR